MIVRQATPEDAQGIAFVSVTTWRHAYRHVLPSEVLDGLSVERRAEGVLGAMEAGGVCWVAVEDDVIVGFATSVPSTELGVSADAELKAIYVLPDHQGAGVGKAVLTAAVRYAREQGFRTMCVFAFSENHQARDFYTGLGARPFDSSTYTLAGVDYPDQSYIWDSLDDLLNLLESNPSNSG